MLWGAAWHQVPAASLPDDDRVLARYAGYGRAVEQWKLIREGALRGFVRCRDGRLYHRTLAEKANAAWQSRLKYEWTKAADRHRKSQRGFPDNQKTEFPGFDDWLNGREAQPPPESPQGDLQLEASAGTVSERAPARTARAPADAHTGATNVPDANSAGTDPPFPRNTTQIPAENALKGREGKGREVSKDSHPNPSTVTRAGRLSNPDLKDLFDACCDAAGLHLVDPGAIDRAMSQVERWRDSGVDFETVVLPTIRAVTLKSDQPSRLLSRFTRDIQHQHAKFKAAAQKGEAYETPEVPDLEPEGEDETLRPLRAALLERHGSRYYCMAYNRIRFENPGQCHGDKRPLIVKGPDYRVETLRHGRQRETLLNVARDLGFTDIW
jgi:hypothetical protein